MRKERLQLPVTEKRINKFRNKKEKTKNAYGFPAQGSRSDFCRKGRRKLKNYIILQMKPSPDTQYYISDTATSTGMYILINIKNGQKCLDQDNIQ